MEKVVSQRVKRAGNGENLSYAAYYMVHRGQREQAIALVSKTFLALRDNEGIL